MVRKIISYFIVLILILLLTASSTLLILSSTILNKNYILNRLQKEDYYSKTYAMIMEKFKDNTIQSGLEDTVLDGIMNEEELKNDVNSFIEYIYTGKNYSINTENIKTRLEKNINKVIEQNKKRVDSGEQNAINIYVKTITDLYEDGTIFSKEYASQMQKVFSKIQNLINKVKFAVFGATIFIALIVILINKKESIKYLSISFISTGLLLIIPKILESIALEIQNVVILNPMLSKTVINLVEDTLFKFMISGIILIVVGIIIGFFTGNSNKKIKQ